MNDPTRDDPTPAAPAAAECPRCGTQLRLLRPATAHTPISCCTCGNTFHLRPVETAPAGDGPPGDPQAGTPPSPADHPPTFLTAPPPPPPSAGARAAPGMPRPVELPDYARRGFRTRWMESVLGAALVLLFVIAACAGAFVLLRTIWPATGKATADGAAAPDRAATAAADTAEPAAVLAATAKPLPRPTQLVGTWESRTDDGSHSAFEFRADGSVRIGQAGDPPPPPLRGQWFLAEQRGGEMVIEVGPEYGAVGNFRFVLRPTSPDAFTLVRTLRLGIAQPSGQNLRFVRAAAPPP